MKLARRLTRGRLPQSGAALAFALTTVLNTGLATGLALPGTANAALDGKTNLICAVDSITACTGPHHCVQGAAEAFDLPRFITVDFKKKEVRTRTDKGETAASPFSSQHHDAKQLLMQGVENNHGWTLAIDASNGHMTTSSTGEEISYILFGACIAP